MPKATSSTIKIDGNRLTLEQVEAIADGGACALTAAARRRVLAARKVVDRAVAAGAQVYGINTGFGHLSNVRIPDERLDDLQRNLIRSHCCGVGQPLPERVVRAILALRANCLARGHSGLRVATLERLVEFLSHGIHPVVPEHGSVGASGDLAPLAHIALTLIGEGEVFHAGKRQAAGRVLKRVGIEPLTLGAKEGLALINGTQVMSALGILTLLRVERLCLVADIVGAMTLEALLGSHRAFDTRIHEARPHPGQLAAAGNLRRLLRGSALERSHRDCGRVQDAYSLRCMAQVHGAVRDALRHVREVLAVEVNASTDNPMVFADDAALISGGNFHGHPVSLALDHLATATCSLGSISERRIERLVNPDLSRLPPFLAADPGLDSGYMLAHVTAASLVAENRLGAHPASIDSIPTSANKEDHVSMGVHAARKAARIAGHVRTILAIELVCAAQALDLRLPLKSSRPVETARRTVRQRVKRLDSDRVLAPDIASAEQLIDEGRLASAVRGVCRGLV